MAAALLPADEVVCTTASNTVFGWPSRGFTIMGATSFGLHIHDVERVQVMGNIALNNSRGFGVEGVGKHTLKGNLALDNAESGFWVFSRGTAVVGNVAASNGLNGFRVFGNNHRLSGNLAVSNQIGFEIAGGDHVMTGNSAIGNRFDGVRITGHDVTVQRNNIYGNHSVPDANAPESGNVNCGLTNSSDERIDATNNFWGSSMGPGADPADNTCQTGGSGQIVAAPFAKKEFRIRHDSAFGTLAPEQWQETELD